MIRGTLRGFTFGDGTDYCLTKGIGGLGSIEMRDRDLQRGDEDGDVGGRDKLAPRLLTFPLTLGAPQTVLDATERIRFASELLSDLAEAWAPEDGPAEVELILEWPGVIPGLDECSFYGRPRRLQDDSTGLPGRIAALAAFRALDPLKYGPVDLVSDSASPAAVTNVGGYTTDRVTITVTGNGGTPSITNVTDDSSTITFAETLAGTAVIDLRAQTVTDTLGNDLALAAGPRWFALLPGVNTLTFSGCASIDVEHRPAWL